MPELRTRGFLALFVALTLLIVPAQVASQTPATIRMVYWPGPESDAMRKVVDWYNANRSAADGVKVEMVLFSREGFFDKEATVLAARSRIAFGVFPGFLAMRRFKLSSGAADSPRSVII